MTDDAMNLGRHKHLMLDDSIIDSLQGVVLRLNPARATGEVLLHPENGTQEVYAYSSVRKEGGRVRFWYDDRSHFATCYAESDDGTHFTRPELNLLGGDLPANAVMAMHRLQGCCVWIDPQAPPERRYKSQAKCGPHPDRPHTLEFFASPDGLGWEHLHGIRIEDCDTQNVVFWDESYGRYVMYTRLWVRSDDPNRNHRKVRRLESDDLVHWDSQSVVWEADAADLATYRTSTGAPPIDYYGAAVYKYPDADDLYICLAEAFWHFKDRPEPERWGHSPDPATLSRKVERLAPSTMDVYLGYSRDGKVFRRPADRRPFLSLGPDGRFDSKRVWALPDPVRMGDELWIYYVGHNRDHDSFVDPVAGRRLMGLGRAVLRLDGFVAAEAGFDGGELVTRPLTFDGDRLLLNLQASGGGSLQVEVLDADGRALDGYASGPLTGDSVALQWRPQQGLRRLAGRPVRLRLRLRACGLYAFQFAD